jgi:PAS domain S-box-containing protein/putative nucleotidyltransferase with HDIG domain
MKDERKTKNQLMKELLELRLMNAELKKSEKKYLDLYQNAPNGYHSIGPGGTILEVNDTWLRMLGYERKEVVNKMKLTDLLTEEGQKIFQKTFPVLKGKGSIENIEYTVRKKDGSFLPVLISATAIYDENKNFLQTRTIIRDISARVAYRQMLEQALEEWRITFDSMPYGVLLLDMEFSVRRANKYFFSLYNIPLKTIKGQKCYEIIESVQLKENFEALRLRNTISLDVFEYYEAKANKHFLMNLTPTPDSDGLTKSFVLAFIDITKIKDTERKLTDSRDAFFNMLKELDFSYKELHGLFEGLIHSFVNAIDAKSPWTKGHSERVTNYAMSIAEEMGLDSDDLETLRIAALLHDIGKIGTYDVILDNPQKLSSEEINLINLHPVKGEMILQPIKQLQHLLPVIRHHHERIDGQGYPDGLKGNDIPLLSKIICIADAFDSMTSDRPYRPAATKEYAISELKRCSNTQFDASLADAFLRVLTRA